MERVSQGVLRGHYNRRMVASMTAFGCAGDDRMDWQIRAVNHRYLELGFRLPDVLKSIEPKLRAKAAARLRRGKVEATLRLAQPAVPRLDAAALDRLLATVAAIRERSAGATVDALELLRWPGVAREDPAETAALAAAAESRFEAALAALVGQREREGAGLAALLRGSLGRLEMLAREARRLAAGGAEGMLARLEDRVAALTSAAVADERLEQELALLAQRGDVTEEIDRIEIHLAAIAASLDDSEPCGRRLNFLAQELGREASTLAAKSNLPAAASLAVDMRVAIEQLREQAQNVE